MKGLKSIGLAALTAVLLVLTVTAAGGLAAGQTSAEDTNVTRNETFAITNETESLRITAENSSDVLDVTITGIDSAGNETELINGTINATKNTTGTYTYSALNMTEYPDYRVSVSSADPTNTTVDYLEVVKIEAVGASGGLFGTGSVSSTTGMVAIALIVLLVLGMVLSRD